MITPALDEKIWRLVAEDEDEGKRLDAVLARLLTDFSRSRLKEFILAGAVSLNGAPLAEPRHKVHAGDEIVLRAPPPADPAPQPEDIPLDILYEDDALIVINKPAGLVVHPARGNEAGTLVNALIHHCGNSLQGIGGERRPGIVHRLDKDTSGVMVVAKTERALNALAAQFADHGRTGPLQRAYTAFAWGRIETLGGAVDAPLGRDANNRLKQAVRNDGRHAITHYQVEARYREEKWDIARLECRLETGRTHQIRVHMAHIGHPLVGDTLYAPGFATKINRLPEPLAGAVKALGRQALHARLLGFAHPQTGEEMVFEVDLPADLAALAEALSPFDAARMR